MSAPSAVTSAPDIQRDEDGRRLLAALRARFEAATAGGVHLFSSAADGLYERFLAALPDGLRQWHQCAACRRFVDRHGGLVRVGDDGELASVLWDPAAVPDVYVPAVRALAEAVTRAPIAGLFLSERELWGRPRTGDWWHLAVEPAPALVYRPTPVRSAAQVAAERRVDHDALLRGLAEFPLELVRQAHALLTTDQLYRSEACISVAAWLLALHERLAVADHSRRRDNLVWQAVAGAPAGFARVRSTMIGTLLEDLAAGLAFDVIKARFDAKMHPLAYQRPSAEPSAGNIARAEEIVAKLGAAGSLARRFARLADIVPLWLPAAEKPPREERGVFSHLRERSKAPTLHDVPPVTMTWDKFARTILPNAEGIEFLVPDRNDSYLGLVTATNPDAPPIVQWDREGARNPVTWYLYVNGSAPARWNLKPNQFHPVTAVTYQPSMWGDAGKFPHHGQKVIFLLKGARDREYTGGAGFFPSFLKSEYHEIRSTLEAYARSAVVEGKDDAEACGICLQKGTTWDYTFRVASKGGVRLVYKLDRWD
jgi:hypothetical protein